MIKKRSGDYRKYITILVVMLFIIGIVFVFFDLRNSVGAVNKAKEIEKIEAQIIESLDNVDQQLGGVVELLEEDTGG